MNLLIEELIYQTDKACKYPDFLCATV
jgi:hypothetical protein